MSDANTNAGDLYLLEKRGYYYRPKSQGYTAFKDEAGRWPFDELPEMCPNFDGPNQDGITFIAEPVAPEYSSGCDMITKLRHQNKTLAAERDALQATVKDMREALEGGRDGLEHALDLLAYDCNQRLGMEGGMKRMKAALAKHKEQTDE